MQKTTPIFPDFHLKTLRRKPRSTQQKLAEEIRLLKEKTFSQLGEAFARVIPASLLRQNKKGKNSRVRIFSKENTFWAFFSQILDADGGCSEVVAKLKAYSSIKRNSLRTVSTGSYCKARNRLSEEVLKEIFDHTVKRAGHLPENEPLNGRRVIVVDGTGLSMPDTKANQAEWPQDSQQKDGCGFPSARVCACFSLETGHALSYEIGNKKSHELRLLRKQHSTFRDGDIFLGDKGFCSYYDMAVLLRKGVDSLVTLARRTPVPEADSIRKLGSDDLLISWKKPLWQERLAYSYEEWKQLPEKLILRQIKINVTQPGFRVKSFYIVTTLIDETAYPADELAELYFRRWEVELNFRDLKTTMGMDVLRCKSPAMIRKEIQMHFTVYNAIRHLIYEAAEECSGDPRRISFKGALQSLRHWEPQLNQTRLSRRERFRLISCLYDAIYQNQVPDRPGRREPRCLKRRLKPYQLLTEHRHTMKETEHRSKYRANAA